MTRINLVPPSELMDQHLFAEFREIKMIPKSLARSIEAAKKRSQFPKNEVLNMVPAQFTLNKGHVSFFYDKGLYLWLRYDELKVELRKRGVNFDEYSGFDPDGLMGSYPPFWNNWTPSDRDCAIIRDRIAQRIAEKPTWYRYYGKPLQHATRAQT